MPEVQITARESLENNVQGGILEKEEILKSAMGVGNLKMIDKCFPAEWKLR